MLTTAAAWATISRMIPANVLQMIREARTVTIEAGPLTFSAFVLEVVDLGRKVDADFPSAPSLHKGFEIKLRTTGAPTEKPQPS